MKKILLLLMVSIGSVLKADKVFEIANNTGRDVYFVFNTRKSITPESFKVVKPKESKWAMVHFDEPLDLYIAFDKQPGLDSEVFNFSFPANKDIRVRLDAIKNSKKGHKLIDDITITSLGHGRFAQKQDGTSLKENIETKEITYKNRMLLKDITSTNQAIERRATIWQKPDLQNNHKEQ